MSKPPQTQGVGFDVALAVKNACLCLHVQRAARSLARLFDEAFRPVGITNGQFSLLMSLNRPGPARMREVAKLLAMDRTTLTAALKTLVRALPIWRDEHARLERGLADADGLRAALLAIS
jgi:hypothetical protein